MVRYVECLLIGILYIMLFCATHMHLLGAEGTF